MTMCFFPKRQQHLQLLKTKLNTNNCKTQKLSRIRKAKIKTLQDTSAIKKNKNKKTKGYLRRSTRTGDRKIIG